MASDYSSLPRRVYVKYQSKNVLSASIEQPKIRKSVHQWQRSLLGMDRKHTSFLVFTGNSVHYCQPYLRWRFAKTRMTVMRFAICVQQYATVYEIFQQSVLVLLCAASYLFSSFEVVSSQWVWLNLRIPIFMLLFNSSVCVYITTTTWSSTSFYN